MEPTPPYTHDMGWIGRRLAEEIPYSEPQLSEPTAKDESYIRFRIQSIDITQKYLKETRELIQQLNGRMNVLEYELYASQQALIQCTSNPIPMEGMPWNIPGGVHSPEATTSEEFLTREVLYHMSKGEDTN